MILGDSEVVLAGGHFLADISLPENLSTGLVNVSRDPRKLKRKPDVFVGVVEEVGPGCIFIKKGDRVAFRRWDWGQMDVDDKRIVAEESDILILDGEIPAPGVVVLNIIDDVPKTDLALPQNLRPKKSPLIKGEVVAFSKYNLGELKDGSDILIDKGDIIYFERSDTNQWAYGNGRICIKVCRYFEIVAIEKKEFELSVV